MEAHPGAMEAHHGAMESHDTLKSYSSVKDVQIHLANAELPNAELLNAKLPNDELLNAESYRTPNY